ncbi:hypothetical protein K457DRAFT_32856 [Linnemannia elongata AG-77]|uniref:Uncharacterized protein n=1 Tax=Linnemannia elongata AG-77 TaxID=1314771 RepID=A0A197JWZ7_9FUNG|nr:hypothetical protein K457DRAFT_32856 [Linnemannia elongata AG-77]
MASTNRNRFLPFTHDLIPVSINWHLRLTPGNTDNDEGDTANKDQDQLELLFPAHHINIRVNNVSLTAATSQQRLVSWEKMMGVLSTLLLECDRRRVHPKLHTLHLREGILENFALQLPQVPRLANLATLRIDIVAQWDIIHLFTILRACPLLEELSVKRTYAASVPTRSTFLTAPQSFLITSLQEHDIINGSHALSTLTRLRTCCLYNIVVTEPALTAVLIASPRLSRLILFGCSYLVRQGGQAVSADDHGNSIIRLIGAHCPDLKSFHLSMSLFDNYGLSSREIFLLLQTFPHMEQCNLTDRVIGLRGLVQAIIVNRITTLNLLPTHPNSLQTRDFPLREILSTFEHLLHLRAPTVVYYLEDMDLFDMRNQVLKNCRGRPESAIPSQQCRHSISEEEPAARQYIWACRGLKTLHIAIDLRYYDSNSTESSLVLFGIWNACGSRPIATSIFLNKTCFGCDQQRPLRGNALYPILHRRARKYLQRLYKGISPSPSEDGAIGSVEAEISQETGVDLKNLGHANDLFNWMEDYYSVAKPPTTTMATTTTITNTATPTDHKEMPFTLPKLQSFWIETPNQDIDASLPKAAKMEEWMRKMRPKVDFQLLRPPLDNYYNMTLRHY